MKKDIFKINKNNYVDFKKKNIRDMIAVMWSYITALVSLSKQMCDLYFFLTTASCGADTIRSFVGVFLVGKFQQMVEICVVNHSWFVFFLELFKWKDREEGFKALVRLKLSFFLNFIKFFKNI